MPAHVKKILNRAYLEVKPYNDTVLHLEREMRLNGLGTPDEVTLVPLHKMNRRKQKLNPNKWKLPLKPLKRGAASIAINLDTIKLNAVK